MIIVITRTTYVEVLVSELNILQAVVRIKLYSGSIFWELIIQFVIHILHNLTQFCISSLKVLSTVETKGVTSDFWFEFLAVARCDPGLVMGLGLNKDSGTCYTCATRPNWWAKMLDLMIRAYLMAFLSTSISWNALSSNPSLHCGV